MAKARVPIPPSVADQVMYDHDSACCVCCAGGKNVQIHHVDDDPSNNSEENLAVVCLQHHSEAHERGGMDRKLTPSLLKKYRAEWVVRVATRRKRADEIATSGASASNAIAPLTPLSVQESLEAHHARRTARVVYIRSLPIVRRTAYDLARPEWDSGVTTRMIGGTSSIIDVMEQAWIHLAQMYPPGHFGSKPPAQYIHEFLVARANWHNSINSPLGAAAMGSIDRMSVVAQILADLEAAISDTVRALTAMDDFDFVAWRTEWQQTATP